MDFTLNPESLVSGHFSSPSVTWASAVKARTFSLKSLYSWLQAVVSSDVHMLSLSVGTHARVDGNTSDSLHDNTQHTFRHFHRECRHQLTYVVCVFVHGLT